LVDDKKITVTGSGGGPDGDDNQARTAVTPMMIDDNQPSFRWIEASPPGDVILPLVIPALDSGFSFWLRSHCL